MFFFQFPRELKCRIWVYLEVFLIPQGIEKRGKMAFFYIFFQFPRELKCKIWVYVDVFFNSLGN